MKGEEHNDVASCVDSIDGVNVVLFFFFDTEDGCSLASTALHDGDNTVGRRC